MKVGLKYCGGCNPDYDRVALAEEIGQRLRDRIEFCSPEMRGLDFILAVQGCPTACADLTLYQDVPVLTLTSLKDGAHFVRVIESGKGLPDGIR